MNDFLDIAKTLGHDVGSLRAGEAVVHDRTVDDIGDLKALLTAGVPDGVLRDTGDSSGGDTSIVGKAQGFVFGDAPLSPADRAQVARAFPMTITTQSLSDKTLAANEVWDLGTSASPVVINLRTLTMEPGSSIRIANTVLTLNVQTLIRNAAAGAVSSANYDLGIFGVTGATPPAPPQGIAGSSGQAGAGGTCGSGGGIAGDDGKPGGSGGSGGSGAAGTTGGDGLPSLTAAINIGSGGIGGTAGQFVVYTRSGDGGQGGPGAKGGNGGQGGPGGTGATCGCEHTNGGNGGNGSNGAQGGGGGIGGNAVKGNDIFVSVPTGQKDRVVTFSSIANPGQGGPGGPGGNPGGGGWGGAGGGASGCPTGSGGSNGSGGAAGASGNPGKPGALTGAPGTVYINEI